jgi:PAS domain S-box-containing protein
MARDDAILQRASTGAEEQRSMADGQPEMVCRFRPDGTILFVNGAYARAHGTTPQAMVGRSFWDFIPDEDRASVHATLAGLSPSAPEVRIENRFHTAAGERWTLWANRALAFDARGRLLEAQSTGIDITERKRAEDSLARSEQELSDFFDSAAIALHWVGPDGRILRVNQAELDMLGYAREEYVGRHIAEFHVEQAVIEGILARLRNGQTIHEHPARMRCKDGSIRDVLIYSSVLFANGEFVHTRCFTYDVTERKRSEQALLESERRMRLVADNLPALIGYVDREHRYRFLNARYAEWFGLERGMHAGIHMRDLLGPDLYAIRLPYIEQVLRGETVRFERITLHHQLGERATDMTYVPCRGRDGQVEGFYVMGFDITERRRTEEALKETDRRKNEFLATLSHELRNPLAPLKNALQALRLGVGDASKVTDLHAIMERQVNHLVRLVDDLLEVSRISRGTFELRHERVDLATVVRNALETSDPLIQQAQHRLEVEMPQQPLWLNGDPVRLAQILSNLLNNAAKYTPAGGHIVVRAWAESKCVMISVADNGAGIAPQALSRIFEMFSRGDQAGEPGDFSLGIGLPLARQLAQMHGGSLEARSEGCGKGAQFIVRLPLAAEEGGANAEAAGVGPASTAKRVLVVDDNPDVAESLGLLLEALGAEVRVVHSGAEALAEVASFDPELVLLDIGMPEMDGYEVARRIRHSLPERRLALVALTGWGQEEDRRRARDAGFDHHLTKPADAAVLQALLALPPGVTPHARAAEATESLHDSGRFDRNI